MLPKLKKRLTAKRVIVTLLCTHDLQSIPPVEHDGSYAIRTLNLDEIDLLTEIDDVDLSVIRPWFERGDSCYIVIADGKPAHFRFVQTSGPHRIVPAARWTYIRPGEFWIYAGRTAPWARGRRISPNVLATILRDHKARGFSRCWGSVVEDNYASRSGLDRTGFRYTRAVRAIWIWKYLLPLSWWRLP